MRNLGKQTLIRKLFRERAKESTSFGALHVNPKRVKFATQNEGEVVYVLLRSHFATNIGWILKSVVYFLFPWLVYLVFQWAGLLGGVVADIEKQIVSVIPFSIVIEFCLVYYSFLTTYVFSHFVNWYYDVYLITNERMIHIDFVPLIGPKVSEAPLENIQDISQRIYGFLPSIFNYGDVLVQTAAEKAIFLFKAVPDPSWFRDVLADLAKIIKQEQESFEANSILRLKEP